MLRRVVLYTGKNCGHSFECNIEKTTNQKQIVRQPESNPPNAADSPHLTIFDLTAAALFDLFLFFETKIILSF